MEGLSSRKTHPVISTHLSWIWTLRIVIILKYKALYMFKVNQLIDIINQNDLRIF